MSQMKYILTCAGPSTMTEPGAVLYETERLLVRRYILSDAEALAAAANFPSITNHIRDGFPSPYAVADAEQFIARVRPADTASYPVGLGIFIKASSRSDNTATNTDTDAGKSSDSKQADLLIGGMGVIPMANVHYRTWELGYWFTPAVARQGYGLEAVRGFVPWAFAMFPDLLRVECHPFSSNVASIGLLEKAGFQREGMKRASVVKDGVVLDELIYGVIREDLPL